MVSLCKPILRVIESSRATQQPDLSGRVIAFLTADAAELPVQVPDRSAAKRQGASRTDYAQKLGPASGTCTLLAGRHGPA